jgi:rhodanese-related sulfurtransferase
MPIKSIDAATLKKWLDTNEAVIVDVREPAEYEVENIAGSTLVPLATVTKNRLPLHVNKKLVLHCRLGKRSLAAAEKLLAEDAALDIFNLDGGIVAWMEAGMPVENNK